MYQYQLQMIFTPTAFLIGSGYSFIAKNKRFDGGGQYKKSLPPRSCLDNHHHIHTQALSKSTTRQRQGIFDLLQSKCQEAFKEKGCFQFLFCRCWFSSIYDFSNSCFFSSKRLKFCLQTFPLFYLPPFLRHYFWHKRIFRQYYNRMGNSSRSVQDYELSSSFSSANWSHHPLQGNLSILRNVETQQLAQVVQLAGIPSIQDMDIFTFRMIENDLVKIYHLIVESAFDLCTNSEYARIVVEFIPMRLSAVREMDREEALTVLCAAFRAFHMIEIKFGPVLPREELIGFNWNGKTKIWLNRDHCVNHPEHNNHNQIQSLTTLSQRIALLYEMVESKTRYVLMTPNTKQQLFTPSITYLKAITIIQKFAYYQKLSLRKYLQLLPSTPQQPLPSPNQYSHTRNKSYHTQLACETNPTINNTYNISTLSKQTSGNLRRIYSLNSFHRESNKNSVYVPSKPSILRQDQRWDRESYIHNSVITDNSNKDSLCPSSARFKHCNQVVNLSNYEERIQEKEASARFGNKQKEGTVEIKDDQKRATISESKLMQQDERGGYNPKNSSIEGSKSSELNKQSYKCSLAEELEPLQNQRKFSIIDKIRCESNDFAYQTDKELLSPTFLQPFNSNCQMASFAPSQQLLRQKLSSPAKQSETYEVCVNKQPQLIAHNSPFEEPNQIPEQIKLEFLKNNCSDGSEQSRRFSIQNRGKKLELPPELALLEGGLLTYCVPVESKLHMATNREHSIIDQREQKKPESCFKSAPVEEGEVQNYIREKYHIPKPEEKVEHIQRQISKHKVQRIESKYVSMPSHTSTLKKKAKQDTSLNDLQEEDFLDVNFLEKSLDMRYNTVQSKSKIEMKKKEIEENDALNVAKLEEGLLKFSQSQLSQKNTEKNLKSKEKESKLDISPFELEQKERKINFSSSHPNFISAFDSYNIECSTGFDSYKQRHQKPKKQAAYREYLTHEYSFEEGNSRSREQERLQRAILEKRVELDKKLGHIETSRKGQQRRISYDELRKLLWN